MASRKEKSNIEGSLREAVGYLNFSSGNSDPTFLKNINTIWATLPAAETRPSLLQQELLTCLDELQSDQSAFSESTQARSVITIGIQQVLPAYQEFHKDVLFHLDPEDYDNPFFLGKIFEAVLAQRGPWTETERIVTGAIRNLNNYVGYRPVATLENDRKSEIYSHEWLHPIPLFIAGAGIAAGRYHDLIEATLQFFRSMPPEMLWQSHFYLDNLEELSGDPRAYDHLHPANKRTNYMFGEWDPHRIDNKGDYRRFIIRQIILESLMDWVEHEDRRTPKTERLFDAAAALCGTMLMASSICGAGPQTHDSTISLTSLLPVVARRRDEFYAWLLASVSGDRATRLKKEEQRTQQPFGHIRQFLNMRLAGYGARQVQHREIAHLYAIMGYEEASRKQADSIPAPSIRIETEIECTVASAHKLLDHGQVAGALEQVRKLPDLLFRGVECGALVDPWNILGFQGQFPLFSAREDSIPDNRVEMLFSLMEIIFSVLARALGEAAARGEQAIREEISALFQNLADWWDRFGSDVIEDLPDVSGQESWESALHVCHTLTQWREAGEEAGDISFWRKHIDRFQSAQAYALVVNALLEKGDHVAAMGLLMQWLSQADDVGVEAPQHTFFSLLMRWMKVVIGSEQEALSANEKLTSIRRLFDFLEANAESWWGVPSLGDASEMSADFGIEDLELGDIDDIDESEDEEDSVFGAAYDDVVFKDSAEDGNWGDTLDDGFGFHDTEFEALNRQFEPRLKFLNAVGQLWQMAAATFAQEFSLTSGQPLNQQNIDAIIAWHRQAQRWQIDLAELMEAVWDHEIFESSGDHDANVEYDMQLQVKFYILHQVINTLICLRNSERLLNGIIPDDVQVPRGNEQDRQLARTYRAIVQRDVETVKQLIPPLLSRLARNPLLYVPLENGGEPGQILRTHALQSVVRFLLRELPRLGLLREAWHVLYTAFRMERKFRPKGQAITEFDRLFSIALRSTLENLTASVGSWDEGEIDTQEMIEAIGKVLDPYQWIWAEHSRTMRISSMDGMRRHEEWEELVDFIQRYGRDLFHASQLTLGNVRAILHNGVDWYLDYLEEEQDPLHPIKLLDDLDAGTIDRDDAEWSLEQVYSIIVDRFDRFLEYNSTTTQSDYGEMIYCLLEFLRLEAQYDRDAWTLIPLTIVHEILVRNNLLEAAEAWEATFEMETAESADDHIRNLKRLQKKYGMRMPTITDHINERFVKPLAVNRILALVKQAVTDARSGTQDSEAFELLSESIDTYLEDSWGSGVDLPDWLRSLEREVMAATRPDQNSRPVMEAEFAVPLRLLAKDEFNKQTRVWRQSLEKQGTEEQQDSDNSEEAT